MAGLQERSVNPSREFHHYTGRESHNQGAGLLFRLLQQGRVLLQQLRCFVGRIVLNPPALGVLFPSCNQHHVGIALLYPAAAKRASAARCASNQPPRKRTVPRRRLHHLLTLLLPDRLAPRGRGQLPSASARSQFGAAWFCDSGSPPAGPLKTTNTGRPLFLLNKTAANREYSTSVFKNKKKLLGQPLV